MPIQVKSSSETAVVTFPVITINGLTYFWNGFYFEPALTNKPKGK